MNDNSLAIRENKATVVQSELDRVMQSYINAEPPYSKEELAKIRRRLSNQLREQKEQQNKAKEQQNKVKEQPKVVEPKEDPKEGFRKLGIIISLFMTMRGWKIK